MKIFHKKIQQMLDRLRENGIQDERVLTAMAIVPRHHFISGAFEFQAYDEKALPIGYGQTISHPFTVARMTELLDSQPGDKILEIGTGSGYQAAVLCAMGAQVFSIELKKPLADKARETLTNLGFTPALRTGNGISGWPAQAPFKGIIVTAAAPVVPEELYRQLDTDGRLLIPVGTKEGQHLTLYRNTGQGQEMIQLEKFIFVPLVEKKKTN